MIKRVQGTLDATDPRLEALPLSGEHVVERIGGHPLPHLVER